MFFSDPFEKHLKNTRSPEFCLQTVPAKKAVNVQAADYTYASSFNVSNFYTVHVKMGRMNGKKIAGQQNGRADCQRS